MQTFKTLLLREWMQHRKGWLLQVAAPIVLTLIGLLFGSLRVSGDGLRGLAPLFVLLFAMTATAIVGVTWLGLMVQLPGLARRDEQDRSIEFWRSLPTSDIMALAATVCTHLVLVPLAVMLIAVAVSAGIACVAYLQWTSMPDLNLRQAMGLFAGVLLRMGAGSLLASLWAASMLLPMMAASAWLKRWGVPMLLATVGIGGSMLKSLYGQAWLLDTFESLLNNVGAALVPFVQAQRSLVSEPIEPIWFVQDLQVQFTNLASPLLAVALALSGIGFALVVWRRRMA